MAARASLSLPLSLLLALTLSGGASAAEFDAMARCSSAKVQALKIFNVGQASLFRADCSVSDPLAPPVRLAFGYNREVPGDAFAKAARKMIERNVSTDTFEALKARIDRFNSYYRTTREGDRYTLDYAKGHSLVLRLNGEKLVEEQGEAFAQAYFSIWFGEDPYSEDLKEQLLSVEP